jgi:hypothetical protein
MAQNQTSHIDLRCLEKTHLTTICWNDVSVLISMWYSNRMLMNWFVWSTEIRCNFKQTWSVRSVFRLIRRGNWTFVRVEIIFICEILNKPRERENDATKWVEWSVIPNENGSPTSITNLSISNFQDEISLNL